MGNLPWFGLFIGDWKKDPALALCSVAARGVWIELLFAMQENGRSGVISGTLEGLAQVCRCSDLAILEAALQELKDTKAAEICTRVTKSLPENNKKWIIKNRRMYREAQRRKYNAGKQKEYRGKERVQPRVQPRYQKVKPTRARLSVSVSDIPPTTPPTKSARAGPEDNNARYERWHRLWNESTKRDDRYFVPAVFDAYARLDRHLAKHYPDADPEVEFKRIAQHIGNDPWYAKNPGAKRAISVFGSAASVDKAIQDSRQIAPAHPAYRPFEEILEEGSANVRAFLAEREAAERAGNLTH